MAGAARKADGTTRERLIAACMRVVARDGLEAASVKTIAAEAGIAPGLLHYHFASKDALLEAALREALEGYRAETARRRSGKSGPELLGDFFADAKGAADTDADFFRLRLAFAVKALSSPDLARVMADLNRGAVEETSRTMAAAAGRGAPRESDVELATVLKAVFDGIMLARLLDPDFPLDAAGRLLETAARDWVARS